MIEQSIKFRLRVSLLLAVNQIPSYRCASDKCLRFQSSTITVPSPATAAVSYFLCMNLNPKLPNIFNSNDKKKIKIAEKERIRMAFTATISSLIVHSSAAFAHQSKLKNKKISLPSSQCRSFSRLPSISRYIFVLFTPQLLRNAALFWCPRI